MIIFGEDYKLPTLTVAVAERMERAGRDGSVRERAQRRYEFIKSLLGTEAVERIGGGKAYTETDTRRIDVAFMLIKREYNQPVIEAQRAALADQVETVRQVGEMLSTFAKVASMPEVLSRGQGRQAFTGTGGGAA